jgi:hypothetical protein
MTKSMDVAHSARRFKRAARRRWTAAFAAPKAAG